MVNPAGVLQIDTTPPTFTLAVATPANADLGVGHTVTLTVTASEAVTVAGGPPTLTLNDGGSASYNAAASTATSLVFSYTVAPGQNTADLAVTAAALNGATVTDAAGNAANWSGLIGNPVGVLQIDTTSADPGSRDDHTGNRRSGHRPGCHPSPSRPARPSASPVARRH